MPYVTWLTQRGTSGFAWCYTSPPFSKHCPSAGPLFCESVPTNPRQHQFTPGTLQANQSPKFCIDSAVWQPTPSWLWSSPTEVVKSARGSGSPTVIIRNAISILKSRGKILVSFRRFCFLKLNFLSLLNLKNSHLLSLSPVILGSIPTSAFLESIPPAGGPR